MRSDGGANKGENTNSVAKRFASGGASGHLSPRAESFGQFMRVEREARDGGARHYVVHVRDPKFSVEMGPDPEAADKVGAGVIKKVCVPNSWAGQYSQYAALLKQAQEFFRQSLLAEPVAKSETRRLKF
jgi:hypothetical protein